MTENEVGTAAEERLRAELRKNLGVDLSQATISVQVDLGKRANRGLTSGATPISKFELVSRDMTVGLEILAYWHVNIFLWWVMLDRLPTCENLIKLKVDIEYALEVKPIFRTPYWERMSLVKFILSMEDEQLMGNVDNRVLDSPKEQLIAVANLAKRLLDAANEQLKAVANLAKRCLYLNGIPRPNMKDVATELEGIRTCWCH
ncbi:hypothetical protein L6452_36812 [Arctium lappa]|uniref:Uncharacterized protein n=1 Tax=Arctium lappa TaxID=4217 RepID=A0ACB8Y0N2_ARCLA|nr:hypothetical protein L6452_36812 [Arctium lappa]